jgi:2-methylcitrate dehydratase PrpD
MGIGHDLKVRQAISITSELAEILVRTRFEDLPARAVEVATEVCLDGIGVTVAGTREPLGIGRITAEYVKSIGGTPESTVLGSGLKTSALNAAYANGTLGHALDFDNTWPPLNHPTSPVLPAILAVAEREDLSGQEVLLAIVLSFEVQGRMRLASSGVESGVVPSFHKPGVSGTIGATAGTGKLFGLDVKQFCMAFGIAGSRCGGLTANTGSMTKATHSGHAARMGVESSMLAKNGFTASEDIFGAGCFFESFWGKDTYDLSWFLKDFGQPYRMIDPGVGFKKHPCNYFTHRPIDACLSLRERHQLQPEQIDRVIVDFPRFDYVNRPMPKSGLEGKFSVQYTTAVALLDGSITTESFSEARRFAPDARALLSRVHLNIRDDIPKDFSDTWARVQVYLSDGRVLEERCDKPRGIWGFPLTRDERLAKFRMCMQPDFREETIDEVVGMVEGLAGLRHLRQLMAILA